MLKRENPESVDWTALMLEAANEGQPVTTYLDERFARLRTPKQRDRNENRKRQSA